MQRHPSFAVPFRARDFGAAQTARRLNSHTLGAHAHGAGDTFLHRATKRDAALQLQSNVFRGQLAVEIRPAHLVDVDIRFPLRQLGDFFFELFDFCALLADHDTGTRRVNIDLRFVGRPLDLDARDTGVIEPAFEKFLDAKIFMQQLGVIMAREPFRIPSLDDAETKNLWMRLLTHQPLAPLLRFIENDRDVAEPLAHPGGASLGARSKPLPHAGFVDFCEFDEQTIDVDALGIFGIRHRRALGNKLQDIQCVLDALAANLVNHQSHFSRRYSNKFRDRACFHSLVQKFVPQYRYVFAAGAGAAAGRGAEAGAPVVSLASAFRSPEWAKKVRVGENSPSL